MLKLFFTKYLRIPIILLLFSVNVAAQQAAFNVSRYDGCAPLSVQFSNLSQNAVSYYWDFGNGNTSTQFNPVNIYSAPGTYVASLIATSPSGLTSTTTATIQVSSSPVADFTLQQTSACQYSGVFSFQNLSSQFDSCSWDFGDGTISSDLHPVHSYNVAGTFNVTLVVYNRQLGCSDTKVLTNLVTVFPAPTASVIVPDSVSCDLSNVFQFNAQVSNAVNWIWDFGDGATSTGLQATHVYQDTGFYEVGLYLTSAAGCVDSLKQAARIHIKWNPVPTINMTSDTGCAPHNLIIYTTTSSGLLYDWTLGNGATKHVSLYYYTYYVDGTYPVQLTITYRNGCQNKSPVMPVVVLPRPGIWFSLTDTGGCAPQQVQFQPNISAPYSWLWDFGDGNLSTSANPLHTYTTHGVFSVSLTATAANGCSATYVNPGKINISAPIAAFSADITQGCPPLQVNFSNSSTNADQYTWNFGDGGSSGVDDPFHTFSDSGQYLVSLIASDNAGCSDTTYLGSPVTVSNIVMNYQVPPVITACAPYSVNFADASGASTYLWDFGDGTTSSSPNPFHIYTAPGTYTVSLSIWMSPNSCEQHIPVFQVFQLDEANPGFTFTVSECPPFEVFFTDTSWNTTSWLWAFGDGSTSSDRNPVHIYASAGTYNITLEATTPGGCQTVLEAIAGVVISGLDATPTLECSDTIPPYQVSFNANSSGATWWQWSFGDGDSSALENPVHGYQSTGPFSISLTIGNDSCSYTYDFPPTGFGSPVSGPLNPGSGNTVGTDSDYRCPPYEVSFSNPVPNAASWVWDFGDGNQSTACSPTHSYDTGGVFLPVLYATDSAGVVDTIYVTDTIFVSNRLSDFQIQTTNLCTGVLVEVNGGSGIDSCHWEFGGGVTANTVSATHVYPNVNSTYLISLQVTDSFNCSSFIAKSLTIEAENPIRTGSRRICAGDSVSFSLINMNFASYEWDFGDGDISFLDNPTHTYVQGGYYNVKLSAFDSSGCMRAFTLADSIEVVEPIAGFSTGNIVSYCPSEDLKVDFINSSSGASSYLWSFGDSTFSNSLSPTHTYTDAGFFDVTLIASKAGCADTLKMDSLVNPTGLTPDFGYTLSSNCVPAGIVFADSSRDAVSWFWEFGDGKISSLRNPVHTYRTNPKDSIRLTVKNRFGCQKYIKKPAPQLTVADFKVDSIFGCSPFTVSFKDSSSNAAAFQWYFGDGAVSFSTDPSHTYQSDGYFNVTLVVTAPSGCTDTLSMDSLIEVNTPVAGFANLDTIGCAPMTVSLTDLSQSATSWLWDLGNGNVSSNQHPQVIYTDPGMYDVTQVVYNKFGCTDTFSIDSVAKVYGAQAAFTLSEDTGCVPFSVPFIDSSVGAVRWEWNFGDGIQDTVPDPVHIYADTGSFTPSLIVFDSIGCPTVFTWPEPVVVGKNPEISYAVDNINGCLPLSVQLHDQGTEADSLLWDFGGGNVLSGFLTSYQYNQAGHFAISLIAYSDLGCTDTMNWLDTVKAFPQPHVDMLNTNVSGCSPLLVQFTNASTQLNDPVFFWTFGDSLTSALENPPITFLSPGFYSVSLVVTNGGVCSDSLTKIDLVEVFDSIPPDPVVLCRATVTESDDILLQWRPLVSDDIDHYIIYRSDSLRNNYDSVATVKQRAVAGLSICSVNDTSVDVNFSPFSYKVVAVDNCDRRLPLDSLTDHQSILLQGMGGFKSASLNWTAYRGGTIKGYSIYRSDRPGSMPIFLDSVSPGTLTYTDTTTWCPGNYVYFVEAVGISGIEDMDARSNRIILMSFSDIADQYVDMVRATVVDDDFVMLEWKAPDILPDLVDRYELFKSEDGINYHYLADVQAGVHYFEDHEVQVDFIDYSYKVLVRNTCDVMTKEGRTGSSILLQEDKTFSGHRLKWTEYQQWDSGVEVYVLEMLDDYGNWIEVHRTPSNVTDWEVR